MNHIEPNYYLNNKIEATLCFLPTDPPGSSLPQRASRFKIVTNYANQMQAFFANSLAV